MKKLLLLLMLFLQVSCASSLRSLPIYDGINPKFADFKAMFIFDSKGKVTEQDFKGLTMGFRKYNKGESTVGTCWPMQLFTEIDITEDYNYNYDYYWRKELVYHEFGHCILGREHTEPTSSTGFFGKIERFFFRIGLYQPRGYLKDGCSVSLMHPEMIGSYCFAKHHDYYILEMFANYDPTFLGEFNSDFGLKRDGTVDWLFIDEIETPFRRPQSLIENAQCGPAIIKNKTRKWSKRDGDTLRRAHRTCMKVYKSCLKKFIKVEELAYQAICGE